MVNSRSIVVGLTGSFGSGCTEQFAIKIFKDKYKWRNYSMSDAMCELKGIDKKKVAERKILQDIGDELRKKDLYAIAKKVAQNINAAEKQDKKLKSKNIVIDGIRNPHEAEFLRDKYPNFFMLAIFATLDTRWKRKKDSYKGNQNLFMRDDRRDSGMDQPRYGQQVQRCVDTSDILIGNDKDVSKPSDEEELLDKVNRHIVLMESPGSWLPEPHEVNMALAYQLSLRSSCSQRKVGAVIIKEENLQEQIRSTRKEISFQPQGYVVATGYNETPFGVENCAQRGGDSNPDYCLKEEKIKEKLKEKYKYCPHCRTKLDFSKGIDKYCKKCGAKMPYDFIPGRMLDLCIAVHGEEAAILQAAKLGSSGIDGCTLYTTTFPCDLCAKKIVQVGVRKVIFAEPYPESESLNIMTSAGIKPTLFEGVKGRAFHRLFESRPKV